MSQNLYDGQQITAPQHAAAQRMMIRNDAFAFEVPNLAQRMEQIPINTYE